MRIRWNPVYKARPFIEIVVVETKQIVSSNSNVILTRQTCGYQMLALGVCLPQPCPSTGHRFAAKITFVPTIQDFELHFTEHFESHFLLKGLHNSTPEPTTEPCFSLLIQLDPFCFHILWLSQLNPFFSI